MIKREEAFAKAFEMKKSRLSARKREYEDRLSELTALNPRLAYIDRAMATAGSAIALTALSGDSAELERLKIQISALSKEREGIITEADIKEISYECEDCSDTGYVGGKICNCIKEEVKRITLKELSAELPISRCRFENFDLKYYPDSDCDGIIPRKRMTQILKFCKEYTLRFNADSSENLLFMGGSGLGKTHLSLAIVYELIEKGFDVIYGSSYNIFSAMENEHFSYKANDSYNAAIACELLVIDDLGSEFISPYIQSMLYNVINTRLLAAKPTVISTNLSMAEIENRYTPRVSSRLMGSYTVKKFCGADVRQLKSLERRKTKA